MMKDKAFAGVSALTLLTHTHTHTHTTIYGPLGFCPGLPGWADTRKGKPVCIHWSKR